MAHTPVDSHRICPRDGRVRLLQRVHAIFYGAAPSLRLFHHTRFQMGEFAIGQAVPRFEDPRLLRGGGRYVDDIVLPRHGVRPSCCARRTRMRASARSTPRRPRRRPACWRADRRGLDQVRLGRPAGARRPQAPRRLAELQAAPIPALVKDRVRWVGDYVAFVVAETQAPGDGRRRADRGRLRAAAGRSIVDRRGAPSPARRWSGTTARTTSASSRSTATRPRPRRPSPRPPMWSSSSFVINRVTAASMEPRGSVGDYNATEDRYTIYTTLQRAHPLSRRAGQARAARCPSTRCAWSPATSAAASA